MMRRNAESQDAFGQTYYENVGLLCSQSMTGDPSERTAHVLRANLVATGPASHNYEPKDAHHHHLNVILLCLQQTLQL